MATGNITAITPLIKQVVKDSDKSVITPAYSSDIQRIIAESSGSAASEPTTVIVGTGDAKPGFVFTEKPSVFNVDRLSGTTAISSKQPSPQKPRRASAGASYVTGLSGENMAIVVTWAVPLVDTAGRWLEVISNSATGTSTEDSLSYYLVQRTNLRTLEVQTVGVVSHSAQAIARIRKFLEAEHAAGRAGAVTDAVTHVATFDTGLYQQVEDINGTPIMDDGKVLKELIIPDAQEAWLRFTDTTAQYGESYQYLVTAVTSDQQEGMSVEIIPGAAQAAAGVSLSFAPGWCSTSLNSDGTAYLDLTVTTGSLVTDVDVVAIPIMDSAIVTSYADTSADPYVVETNPVEVSLYVPGSGSYPQTVEFVGSGFESHGGIKSIDFGAGITVSIAALSKTEIAAPSYRYTVPLQVAAGSNLGPRTASIVCSDGAAAYCSQFTCTSTPSSATSGAVFDAAGKVLRGTELTTTMSFTGSALDTIASISYGTITKQSYNYLEVSFLFPAFGTYTVNTTLKSGYTTGGKDYVYIVVAQDYTGDHHSDLRGGVLSDFVARTV